ncbi:hypothetical protein [Chitinimonas sp. BJB300]|uniref:hypothetical protein n=1 Tax=Chitinimonas sp. BJB300 TaxID=1559339 RepID=UPI000C0EBE7A|nr:hypothetical protein [Chitinimonas sp. BJB300]PHV13235.1 hypothetical protein CSQ89_01595 [Chitinimonas sp. BJB300]TSJ89628.1 hypothetical protein FG002_005225 [Chitinimonas sp. BJB300]
METTNALALDYLRSLRIRLDRGDRRILIDYPLQFTKGTLQQTQCELFVDQPLRDRVANWTEQLGGFASFISRYQDFDPRMVDQSWPAHFPVHVLSAKGQIVEGRNIFMFFPEVLGLSTGQHNDYFGLELIDIWDAVFDQVITPCVQRMFDAQTQFDYFESFCTQRRELIYLASVFHEIGHRVGPWKVSPCKDENIHLSKMQVDIMGELSTDTYLVKFLPEFPELASFVLYQRLFWFGRMHYEQDSVHGALNTDNDAWIGAYLWQIAERVGCLSHDSTSGLWRIARDRIASIFDVVFDELQAIGAQLLNEPDQIDALQRWIDERVPKDEAGQFIYPDSMAQALRRCADVPTRVRINQPIKV